MSAGTAPTTSTGGSSESQMNTKSTDKYIHQIDDNHLLQVTYLLDEHSVWEEAAAKMGYTKIDIIKIQKMAREKGITQAEQLLSLWADQNHTVTELYMLLYQLQQFSAMECLQSYVDKKYHKLLLHGLPNFDILLNKRSQPTSKTHKMTPSSKILNAQEKSRDVNESAWDSTSSSIQSSEIGLDDKNMHKIHEYAQVTPEFKYNELKAATSDWSDANVLGRGGFGIVYKGYLKNTEVAIKKIVYRGVCEDSKKKAIIQLKQSLNELRHLNSCRHDNVLPLYGFSLDQTVSTAEPCLVYQFMAGGSLEHRLHPKNPALKPLSFNLRNRIILGTARGIQYLHTYIDKKPLIHGDIKPANILLDPCGVPKIGDFGLVRQGSVDPTEVSSVYGTRPYLPIEFLLKKTLSTKIDSFSFGVVLFELYTGLKAHDKTRARVNSELALLSRYMWSNAKDNKRLFDFLDKNLQPEHVCENVYNFIMTIGLNCTLDNADKRPEMQEVYKQLEKCIPAHFLPD